MVSVTFVHACKKTLVHIDSRVNVQSVQLAKITVALLSISSITLEGVCLFDCFDGEGGGGGGGEKGKG